MEAARLTTGRDLASFSNVADWGCGAGRLTQHFAKVWPGRVTGIDVDPTNIAWLQNNVPAIPALVVPWTPPTNLPSNFFDILFAFSVFSHIREQGMDAWLAEVERVLKPGGVAVITTLGLVSTASRGARDEFYEELFRNGYIEWGNKGQLDDVRPAENDYLNIAMTYDFAEQRLSRHFIVRGLCRGLGPQDAWVLEKRAS
jgi:SAM-dependent methyltransferase